MARTKTFDKDEVLEKALHLFWQKGYDATSMQDLVNELGLSRSSIYDTFGDKHQLYLAVLRRYRGQASERSIRMLREASSPRSVILGMMMSGIVQLTEDEEAKGCFMVNTTVELAATDQEIAAIALQNKVRIVQAFENAIGRGQAMGEISTKHSAQQLAEFFYSIHNGLQVVGKIERDFKKLKKVVEVALSVLD